MLLQRVPIASAIIRSNSSLENLRDFFEISVNSTDPASLVVYPTLILEPMVSMKKILQNSSSAIGLECVRAQVLTMVPELFGHVFEQSTEYSVSLSPIVSHWIFELFLIRSFDSRMKSI